jgi:hypothetical protein
MFDTPDVVIDAGSMGPVAVVVQLNDDPDMLAVGTKLSASPLHVV